MKNLNKVIANNTSLLEIIQENIDKTVEDVFKLTNDGDESITETREFEVKRREIIKVVMDNLQINLKNEF